MTVLVGILCADGVVIATDSEATLGAASAPTVGKVDVQKLIALNDHTLMAVTGAVGMMQMLAFKLKELMNGGKFAKHSHWQAAMAEIAEAKRLLVKEMIDPATSMVPLIGNQAAFEGVLAQTLVATVVAGAPQLFQFGVNGAPEAATDIPCVSLGSGAPAADRFLAFMRRLLWKDGKPAVKEARLVAAWTVKHAAATSAGGVGGPIQMACLSKRGAVWAIETSAANEHEDVIASAEAAVACAIRQLLNPNAAPTDAAAPPPPPVT